MDGTSTKDRILDAALTLFSEKGYDGVGVDEIAEAAGLKGPSLYRHYKGKKEILNAVIDKVERYYQANFGGVQSGRLPASGAELVEFSLERIRFTMHDPVIQRMRRLLAMEQFRSPYLAALTTGHHLDGLQELFRGIFQRMMAAGRLREDNPALLALEFVSPVTLLIQMCDRQPEREQEAMERIGAHLRHFAEVYEL